MEPVKVVVRHADGRIVKGFTSDFFPNKPLFHVSPRPGGKGEEVHVGSLKAVFFVKDFAGDRHYREAKGFAEGKAPAGRRAEVTFKDGEVMVGTTLGYDPQRPGFFLVPSDAGSNNMRAFLVAGAVRSFRFL